MLRKKCFFAQNGHFLMKYLPSCFEQHIKYSANFSKGMFLHHITLVLYKTNLTCKMLFNSFLWCCLILNVSYLERGSLHAGQGHRDAFCLIIKHQYDVELLSFKICVQHTPRDRFSQKVQVSGSVSFCSK